MSLTVIRLRPSGVFAAVFTGDSDAWWKGLSEEQARQIIELDNLYYELADERLTLLRKVDVLEKRIEAIKGRVQDIADKADLDEAQ